MKPTDSEKWTFTAQLIKYDRVKRETKYSKKTELRITLTLEWVSEKSAWEQHCTEQLR